MQACSMYTYAGNVEHLRVYSSAEDVGMYLTNLHLCKIYVFQAKWV